MNDEREELRMELNEEQMNEVNGGQNGTLHYQHNNCGGIILNYGDPLRSCRCSRCGEEHYLLRSFNYTEVSYH